MARHFQSIVITNNPCLKAYKDIEVFYCNDSALIIMEKARELVYQGYRLLTHPLGGNWEINVPYKSLLLEKRGDSIDSDSVFMLERSIRWLQSLARSNCKPGEWPDRMRHDFQLIDQDIFNNALKKHHLVLDTL